MVRESVVLFAYPGKRYHLLVVRYGGVSETTWSLRKLNTCVTRMIIIVTTWCECIGAVEGLDIDADVRAELRVQSVEKPVGAGEDFTSAEALGAMGLNLATTSFPSINFSFSSWAFWAHLFNLRQWVHFCSMCSLLKRMHCERPSLMWIASWQKMRTS